MANISSCPRSSAPNPCANHSRRFYLAAYAPAALKRAATVADGWMPVGIPLDGMTAMTTELRRMAKDAGRDPQSLEVIVGANISITPEPLDPDRPVFAGST
jgi:alkanesulfonate monooxygenase SsuD/methylene tetrahydromethanopterin reductase-like flavin-dependent oxidoreductase (luciferase family)